MGVLFFFNEEVPAIVRQSIDRQCQIEVADNHGVPEVRIGPVGAATKAQLQTSMIGASSRDLLTLSMEYVPDYNKFLTN